MRLKECLAILDSNEIEHPPENQICKAIREKNLGATSNTSQWFNKKGLTIEDSRTTRTDKEQKVCMYIRHSQLDEDILRKLDKGS